MFFSAYHDQFGHKYTSAIPTNIFGQHDNLYVTLMLVPNLRLITTISSDLEGSHVIPGLIHKCYLAKSAS